MECLKYLLFGAIVSRGRSRQEHNGTMRAKDLKLPSPEKTH
jgi:hypothetical protein